MAAIELVQGFRFDFDELRRPARSRLHVVAPALEPLPAGARRVLHARRPRWLDEMLPVIRTGEPLRVGVVSAEAPVWAARLRAALALVFATAAAHAVLETWEWRDGLAVTAPGLRMVPRTPHVLVVATELDPASIECALAGRSGAPPATLIALLGRSPKLERRCGLDADAAVVRFPLLAEADLGRTQPSRPLGRACVALATHILERYREADS